MKLPKLNVRLLNRIKRHLAAEPKRYSQSVWGTRWPKEEEGPACGTQGCIAGWAVFLKTPRKRWHKLIDMEYNHGTFSFADKARKLLGLTESEASKMFNPSNQKANHGRAGVKEAHRKIDLLLKDREKFVERY